MTTGTDTAPAGQPAGKAGAARLSGFRKRGSKLREGWRGLWTRPVGPDGQGVRICSWSGWRCVYGLHWLEKPPPPTTGPPVMVRWRKVWAVAAEKLHIGAVPLSALIADSHGVEPGNPEWNEATIIAAAKEEAGLYFATVMGAAEPLAGTVEQVFEDLDSLISWVQRECNGGEIAQVLASDDVLKMLNVRCLTHQLTEAGPRQPEILPELESRPWPVLIRLVVRLALLAGIAWGVWWAVDRFLLNRPQAEIETREVAYVMPLDAFLASCHEQLRKPWPVPPGWETEISGCTTSLMDDPHVQDGPTGSGLAYRRFILAEGHDGTLARAAASALLDDFDGRQKITDTAIILERVLGLQRRKLISESESSYEQLRVEAEAMFLGLADELKAQERAIEIRTTASIPTIIRRLVELHQKHPISLQLFAKARDGLTLRIVPQVTIWVEERVQ